MKTISLDTNIAIDILNGKEDVIRCIENYDLIYLPITVCGELLFGAKNSSNSIKNEVKYKNFIDNFIILESNLLIAEKYADIRLELKLKGKPIPENDIWIASISMVNSVPLMSNDQHFKNITGLELIDPNEKN